MLGFGDRGQKASLGRMMTMRGCVIEASGGTERGRERLWSGGHCGGPGALRLRRRKGVRTPGPGSGALLAVGGRGLEGDPVGRAGRRRGPRRGRRREKRRGARCWAHPTCLFYLSDMKRKWLFVQY